jgi:uncharacterized protein (DUF1697 family)
MEKYAAFLRGINSGKNPRVKMEVLREAFEKMGFENVRTVIASGNVIFEAPPADVAELERKIEMSLPGATGFSSDVFVLAIESLRKLTKKNPFEGIEMTSREKPYVTFIKGDTKIRSEIPIKGRGFTIMGIYDGVVYSVVDLSLGRTPDLMRELNKIWEINTTRGWKTIERILR